MATVGRPRTAPDVRVVKQWQLGPYLFLEASDSALELVVTTRDRGEQMQRPGAKADAPDPVDYNDIMRLARAWKAAVHDHPYKEHQPSERAAAYAALESPGGYGHISGRTLTAFLMDYHAGPACGMDVFVRTWPGVE
jgi:hypothetical protein